ncbi:MAG TPA: segregation/condensation protein A [Anaerolineae bacterium]|nr:segregation/condensation protein A [Anaerolineae bacterium]HIP72235.1 segregation/condensation protein A [Anaerolineae bacterium]
MINQYKIDLPAFSGPLDLLLHLIEREELDITAISLAKVTQQYLAQVEHLKENRMEQLIDFLVIAARLVLIKSRALLPQSPVVIEGEDEEDPAEALVRQLRLYKQFKQAAGWLGAQEEAGLRTYLRIAPPPKLESRLDMSGITLEMLVTAVHTALARTREREESVAIIQPRRITIEGQIRQLQRRVKTGQAVKFRELLSEQTNPVEISVTLLAVLELIKRQEILARQPVMFGPIEIIANV